MSSERREPVPPELHEFVRAMREDRPGGEQLAEVARRLGLALPADTPPAEPGNGPAMPGPAPTALPAAGLPALAGAALASLALAGVATVLWHAAQERSAAPDARPALQPSDAAPGVAQPGPEPVALPAALDSAAAALPSAPAAPEPAREPAVEVESVARRRPPREPAAPEEPEHALLADARRLLPVDPARALELADRHRERFPSGFLAPEREMIAVDALDALGRRADAEARARALAERWPSSAYARRVRARGLVP